MGTPAAMLGSGGISQWLLGFLQDHFREPEDLASIQSLTARLKQECGDHQVELLQLKRRLSLTISSWISQSNDVGRILSGIESGHPCTFRDGSVRPHGKILLVELPSIAKAVGRIQSVRLYAETALRLETLVGDLEDATFSMMKQVSRQKFENVLSKASNQTVTPNESGRRLANLLDAVKAMKDIEETLAGVATSRPRWANLLIAVDSRVDKALAILRPQCLTDYRIQIASLGWPPPLSTSNVEEDNCMAMRNPLLLMQGETKARYSQSFSALCSLQKIQAKREARSRDRTACNPSDFDDEVPFFIDGLWAIDELVNPVASRMEYHFSIWLDQPQLIFALVCKITQNLLKGVEVFLQPLIDNARLLGCSAKEAWVAAMIRMLSRYLERLVLPTLVKNHCNKDAESDMNSSFLHMVDLMINFTKRMKILSASGTHATGSFAAIDGLASPSLSIMSIFNEHSEWLQMWAEMEVKDAEARLKPQLEDERSWLEVLSNQPGYTHGKEESFLLLSSADYKAPLIADSVFHSAWVMIERGLALPCSQRRNQFIISSANLFLTNFFCTLLERSRDAESMDAVSGDTPLLRICSAINTACYSEHVLHDWSEDVSLMEDCAYGDERLPWRSFFEDRIMFLVKLQTDCLEEIATALLLHFDNLCWNYVQDREQWETMKQVGPDYGIPDEDYLFISPLFIQALDMLRDRIQFLNLNLNSPNFLDLWRSIAGGIDHFIFSSIPMSNGRFSSLGVYQFKTDMKALFLIFRPFCARPEAFFPCTSNSLKLLEINKKDADEILECFSQGLVESEDWLRLHGLFHVSPAQAEKVLRNRMFGA